MVKPVESVVEISIASAEVTPIALSKSAEFVYSKV